MMKSKIIGIFVCMLFILAAASTVARTTKNDTNTDIISTGIFKYLKPIKSAPIIQTSPSVYDPANAFMVNDPLGTLSKEPCIFNILFPGNIFVQKAWTPGEMGFCTGAAWTLGGKLYMCDYSLTNSNIYEVNPRTGDSMLVGPSGVSLHAMTYDVEYGVMQSYSSFLFLFKILIYIKILLSSFINSKKCLKY